ncbi:Glycosyltransferase GTB-type domain-containing protein [Acanthamoeba polyphaga moumouvirus]|uniref:Glycosyltransferase GTB-type domain-containing protein n=1 Tax=Acanthamoeba polyphaga moumouvirus TaxID=1269028 RepID=L7RBT7_9VIRU|nr:Glycosyltransferase GTB-type domain-containing protein [Acanthamoeba polyphaga moumouvirus]AGC01994.1 Glycosyltransferase GTB-type domain-containing protein [Acanthamoeba polyphaga moumouvirus]AQN68362.1 glycosyltransferase GTB-type domain protein [Saudi moumouvirus]
MKNFVIANPYDIDIYGEPFSDHSRSLTRCLYKNNSRDYFKNYNINIIPIANFITDINIKYEIMDYNVCQKYYTNNSSDNLTKIYYQALNNFINEVKQTNNFNNSIILAVQVKTIDFFYTHFPLLKSKGIKIIFYYDDIHNFSIANKHITIFDIINSTDKNKLVFKDDRLENCSYLLTTSKYFNYIGIYQNKTIIYYPPVDDIIFSMYTPVNLLNRTNKILLTSNMFGYNLDNYIFNTLNNKNDTNNSVAVRYYDFDNAVCSTNNVELCKTSGLLSNFKKFSKYQGVFIGYFQKPLNNVPWKIFEVLASGSILFVEENDILDDLGLEKNLHYVPVTRENLFNEEYLKNYIGTDIGRTIALNGYNFVRKYNAGRKNLDFFINLIKSIN